jgi:hypothetical protein
MPAVSHDRFLCTSLAQAREQEWQPIQRSILGVVKIFIAIPPLKDYFANFKTKDGIIAISGILAVAK